LSIADLRLVIRDLQHTVCSLFSVIRDLRDAARSLPLPIADFRFPIGHCRSAIVDRSLGSGGFRLMMSEFGSLTFSATIKIFGA
jgi:hypothetical protein